MGIEVAKIKATPTDADLADSILKTQDEVYSTTPESLLDEH
jgi:hypothetical protein